MARSKKGDHDARAKFLAALAQTASVTAACTAASVPRRTAYNWRNADEAFAAQWDEALESGTDELEDEAVRRAKAGSDTLLIFMLKARRPERFKDRVATEHSGNVSVEHKVADDADRFTSAIIGLAARAGAKQGA